MRVRLIILAIIFGCFSCEKEREDTRDSWIQEIDATISEYERIAEVEKSIEINNSKEQGEIKSFKKSNSGVSKIEMSVNYGGNFPMKIVYYIKNNVAFLTKWSGLSPYFHKGQKREGDKCCAIFEKNAYFNSQSEAIAFHRKIDLMTSSEMDERKQELKTLPFEEETIEDVNEEYNSISENVREMKLKLSNN